MNDVYYVYSPFTCRFPLIVVVPPEIVAPFVNIVAPKIVAVHKL